MASALEEAGYEVLTAGSGAAARQTLEEGGVDLLVLDLQLHDTGGAAWVQSLQREDRSVPFVVVTGQGDEKVAVSVMKQGALDYVMKDTAMLDLLPEVVGRALRQLEQARQLTQAQASLRESVERFSAAVRATNDGVWEWLIPEDRVYFSDRWKAILGFEPEAFPHHRSAWLERMYPEDRERLGRAQESCLAGAKSFSLEYRMRHRDGHDCWILCRALLDRDERGRPHRFTGAHTDITENKRLEQELLEISEREQRRIGQDLHDGLGQQLTAIELMCHSIKSDLEQDNPVQAAQLGRLSAFLRQAVTQTRSLAHGLTAFMLDASGLQAALVSLAERTSEVSRVRCRFEGVAPESLTDATIAGHLYRIAQEAVTNALRHGEPSEIVITLKETPFTIVLTVRDDGRGFAPGGRRAQGMGLQVMEHRARAVGADLVVDSRPAGGTVVQCIVHRRL